MGMQNATIYAEASVTTTGTASTLQMDSVPVKGGLHLVDISITDYASRPNVFVAASSPIYNKAEKSYANAKKSAQAYFPKTLVDGQVKTPSIEIIVRDNPCQTAEDIARMRAWAIQFLSSTDFAGFWATGSLS